ncbi:MAG: hypothetical protein EAZ89_02750 [Bacteroidetes bacterium]|nr:MAG: hypothetical protein EAZ89_02750 [Bacteroidota bacterium]
MEDYKQQLRDLGEIRRLVEESSRFVSLSGLSGVAAGVVALIGAAGTAIYLDGEGLLPGEGRYFYGNGEVLALVGIALLIFVCAVGASAFFTLRNTRRQGKKVWTAPTRRLMYSMVVPLAAGAVFCIQLALSGEGGMVPGATLLFYGLALLNAGKYTLLEIRYLGISEVVLGLIAVSLTGYGIFFWAFGFGVLHIGYGLWMYLKYER